MHAVHDGLALIAIDHMIGLPSPYACLLTTKSSMPTYSLLCLSTYIVYLVSNAYTYICSLLCLYTHLVF